VTRGSPAPPDDRRPVLAVLAPELTPYRIHFHRRIVREIPELRLATILLWDPRRSPWAIGEGDDIGVVRLGDEPVEAPGGPARLMAEWRKSRRLTRWLASNNVGAVFTSGYNQLACLAAMRWTRRRGIPSLMWADSNIHGDAAAGPKRTAKHALIRWVLRNTSAVLPCGSLGRDYYLRYGADPGRIFLCPYEPDYSLIEREDPALTRETLARFKLDPTRRRILVCGRLVQVKRPDLSLVAFLAIARERPDWDLVFAGDGPLRAELEARIPVDLRPRITFTGFIADQPTLTSLYHVSQVLLHPADYEPWALVINEAAAAGLAIVTTTVVGAAAELVRDGVNGFRCPPGDAAAIADRLRAATDPETLPELRAGSKAVLIEWRRVADPVQGLRNALAAAGALRSARHTP
jgi:glycosyltransferase involved in cell wall biosynthesis